MGKISLKNPVGKTPSLHKKPIMGKTSGNIKNSYPFRRNAIVAKEIQILFISNPMFTNNKLLRSIFYMLAKNRTKHGHRMTVR